MPTPSIEVRNLSKTYRLYWSPYGRMQERMPWNRAKGRQFHRPVHALKDIDFSIEPGQCIGLLGGNGAGKSTLLKILTGTTFPSAGSYTVRGRVASLLELGAGFHMDFTGRENIFMNAAMMGLSRKETQAKYEEILEFSELEEFIDAPLRTYSSGMMARLGFSVAVAVEPDVLIIDEILAVGDMHFQRKCVDRIWRYKHSGKTLFFCSHSLYDIRQICDRALWMRDGQMVMMDDAVTVTNEYASYENSRLEAGSRRPQERPRRRSAAATAPAATSATARPPQGLPEQTPRTRIRRSRGSSPPTRAAVGSRRPTNGLESSKRPASTSRPAKNATSSRLATTSACRSTSATAIHRPSCASRSASVCPTA